MVKYCWDQATQHFLLSFLALHLMSWSQEEWSDLNKQINSYSSTECITMMKSTQTLSIASNTKTVKSNHTILFMHVPDLALVVLCASWVTSCFYVVFVVCVMYLRLSWVDHWWRLTVWTNLENFILVFSDTILNCKTAHPVTKYIQSAHCLV
jgi:hypothetical protein